LLGPDLPGYLAAQRRPPLKEVPARSGQASRIASLAPGVALCGAVSLASVVLERVEFAWFGRAWLEALVLAILIGATVRSFWTPGRVWLAGIGFSAKFLLEVAVMLLGASISAHTVMAAGLGLVFGIAAIVALAICVSFGVCRLLRLPPRMAVLVACGNSICGNSAIAAVAPVIGANSEDVACSIAFTAVLGVIVVLSLPLLVPVLALSNLQYGVLAGLTVYAVPQVLAATAPIGTVAVQIGTVVKLVRVLMLGPVVLALSLFGGGLRGEVRSGSGKKPAGLPLRKMVPWFIVGFLLLASARSAGLLPHAMLPPMAGIAGLLTILSMAALGLGVDMRVVARAGARVTGAVSLSLLLLCCASYGLIRLLGVR